MDIPALYQMLIAWIGDGTGQSDTILHIHAGMAVMMATRILSGQPFGTFVPFAAVLLAEMGNELLDRLAYGSWRWMDTGVDMANTLFWPALITLGVRLRPIILREQWPQEDDAVL
jgi:hypothetical protein